MLHIPSPAASTNTRANGSLISGFSLSVSAARAAATPSAVAPTLWVISQESLSVRGIASSLPHKVSYAHYSSSRRRPRPPVAPVLVFFPDGPQVARECHDAHPVTYAARGIRPPRHRAFRGRPRRARRRLQRGFSAAQPSRRRSRQGRHPQGLGT